MLAAHMLGWLVAIAGQRDVIFHHRQYQTRAIGGGLYTLSGVCSYHSQQLGVENAN
jgi:hypothetical protein